MIDREEVTPVNMLENLNLRVDNRYSSNMRLNNLIIRQYFKVEESAKYNGYLDKNKLYRNKKVSYESK